MERKLIVTPANLTFQWQRSEPFEELRRLEHRYALATAGREVTEVAGYQMIDFGLIHAPSARISQRRPLNTAAVGYHVPYRPCRQSGGGLRAPMGCQNEPIRCPR